VLLLAALALAVRAYRLGLPDLSGDESFSCRLASHPAADLVRGTAADVHPPLYYLVLRAWAALGWHSPAWLRGLSVFWGVLTVPLLYLLCLEACTGAGGRRPSPAARGGAVFAAALLAVHLAQVTPSRTARMYSQGVFLAVFSAWLLLRALRCRHSGELWWSAYGLSVAAFCYTHYYAFFTVFAQALFVAGHLLVRACRHGWRTTWPPAAGFLFAAALAFILYTPWLPILSAQVRAVRGHYWIPAPTLQSVEAAFFSWAAGAEWAGKLEARFLLLLLVGLTAWRLACRDGAALFFLLLAGVPWGLSLGFSWAADRPIFVARYLAFAQVALLAFWGVIWCRMPGAASRSLLAVVAGLPAISGLEAAAEGLPKSPPAIAEAAAFLVEQARPGDVVLLPAPSSVHRLFCYAGPAGAAGLALRCRVSPFSQDDHITHVAALRAEEAVWDGEEVARTVPRLWRASDSAGSASAPPPGMRLVLERTFRGGGGTAYSLALYERAPPLLRPALRPPLHQPEPPPAGKQP
jgi:mannosyltransferase